MFPPAAGFALVLLFAACFILGAWHQFNILARAHASGSWPQAQGFVTSTELRKRSFIRGGVSWLAVVTCEYTVAAARFRTRSHDARLQPRSFGKRTEADEHLASFSNGRQVSVYYDPQKPERAILNRGIPKRAEWIALILGSGAAAFALLFAWGAGKTLRQMRGSGACRATSSTR